MQISHKYKFIFFSFPKTGSESIRALLEPFSDEPVVVYSDVNNNAPFYSHMSPREVQLEFIKKGWEYDSYFKFVVVRNPWERMVSLYEMIYRHPLKKIIRPSFDSWIKGVSNSGKGAGGRLTDRWRRYGSYSLNEYIYDGSTNCLVDDVLMLEELDIALPKVLKKLNLPNYKDLSLKRINVNPSRRQYRSYYSEYSKKRVFDLYKEEINAFSYKF